MGRLTSFLTSTPGEWQSALTALAADPVLRRRIGEAGRARFEGSYSREEQTPRLAWSLQEATERHSSQTTMRARARG